MKPTERQSFFTLVEIIVATAILAMLGLLIGMSAQTFYRSYNQAQKVGNELQRNQAIDRLVNSYFVNAVPFEWDNLDEETTEPVFEGKTDELSLTALRRAYGSDTGALSFIRLYCDDGQLKCDYSSTPLLPWLEPGEQVYETEIIAENVAQIDFLYADRYDGEIRFLEEWDKELHDGIPLAIQLTVTWQDGSKERWLRRTAGSSGTSTFGERGEPTE